MSKTSKDELCSIELSSRGVQPPSMGHSTVNQADLNSDLNRVQHHEYDPSAPCNDTIERAQIMIRDACDKRVCNYFTKRLPDEKGCGVRVGEELYTQTVWCADAVAQAPCGICETPLHAELLTCCIIRCC